MAGHREIATVAKLHNFAESCLDEPQVVKAELPHECPHTLWGR